FLGGHERASFEYLDVLHHGRERDAERLGDGRDRRLAVAKLLDDPAEGGIAEGLKDALDVEGLCLHCITPAIAPSAAFECFGQVLEQFAGALLADPRSVGALEEGRLPGEDQTRAAVRGQELHGAVRGGDAVAEVYWRSMVNVSCATVRWLMAFRPAKNETKVET